MPKLSVTVITRNESANIAGALESIAWADDIVVVDSESHDDTVAQARRFTERVVVRPWSGYAAQKNFAASLAAHDWILSLDADERVTPALAAEIRTALAADSPHAKTLLPHLLQHVRPDSDADQRAVELLRQWNFTAAADSAAEPIFQAWFLRLAAAVAGDELGPVVLDNYRGRFSYTTRFVTKTLAAGDSPWCDDVTTPAHETCEQVITRALHDGVADLTERLGPDMERAPRCSTWTSMG